MHILGIPCFYHDAAAALIEYVDGKVRGEVATKEDLLLLKAEWRPWAGRTLEHCEADDETSQPEQIR